VTPSQIQHALRDLSPLDIENAAAGRITKDAMHTAARRLISDVMHIGGYGTMATDNDMWLADELNDILQAARESYEHRRKEIIGK